MTAGYLPLDHRSVLRLSGADRTGFLNGLVTNSIDRADAGTAVYAGLLTPQGKFLFDMLVFADSDALWLDVERALKDDLIKRLTMYKLRADVTVEDMDPAGWRVIATFEPAKLPFLSPDPRHPDLGNRGLTDQTPDGAMLEADAYEARRIRAGVPDGARDIEREKYFWPETNAEALNGTDYKKGCYVGQELVSRLKHRSDVRKLILPAVIEGGAPAHGTAILDSGGKPVGTVRTSQGENALVYIRRDAASGPVFAETRKVTVLQPGEEQKD